MTLQQQKGKKHMKRLSQACRLNKRLAERVWGRLSPHLLASLQGLTSSYGFSVGRGDIICLDGRWYVTHAGLLRLSFRRGCSGMHTEIVSNFCDPSNNRWTFKATVFRNGRAEGFVAYGDADPSNVSFLVHGAEMRVAETRAVNRALRKAYGIGICSVEELGSLSETTQSSREPKKLPPQPANGNYGGPRVRDRLCQIIREHQLDPNLVKAYATDFCGVKVLREATREQVENFVKHLADWAEKDRNALLCQLNSYPGQKEGAA
jgi:hypothetical protein